MRLGHAVLGVVIISALSACSGGDKPNATDAPTSTGAQPEVTDADRAPAAVEPAPTGGATTIEGEAASSPGPVTIADDVLPPDRRTTWRPGVTYGGGGIPGRTDVCASLSPGDGDDTAAIQEALDACPAGGVVELSAGTFEVRGAGLSFRSPEVTLRGAGPGEPGTGEGGTRLVKADRDTNPGAAILYIGNHPGLFASSTDLAADAAKGTNTVTLTEDPGLNVGEYVLIDHVTNDDPDVVWNQYHDGPGGGSRRWFARQDRSLTQILEVTAVEGTTVTFATPFHWTFRADFDAQLSRYGDDNGGNVLPFLERAGVEDIYFYGGMGGDYHGNIAMSTCAYCWIRNVESHFAEGTAIGLYGTYRSEVRDSYIHSTPNPNPGGGGYLTGVNNGGSDNLIENNILWQGNKMIVMRASGGGNVIAYNYMEDGFGAGYASIVEVGLNAGHYTTPHMELLEGNQAFNADGDSYWGNSIAITLFRNHLTGERRDVAGLGLRDEGNRRMASLNQYQYDYNFLGNVLGTEDMTLLPGQERFVYEATDLDQPEVPIWQLGYVGEDPGKPFDPKVAETAIRHGNFDYFTDTVAWDPELSQALPPSLYQAEKPAFFGDLAWPWVTPESTDSHVATLPARARFDAMPHEPGEPLPQAPTDDSGSAAPVTGSGTAEFEIDGPNGSTSVDASFVLEEYSETSDGRVHLMWESADGGYLILELTDLTVGTQQSTGSEPFALEVTASAASPEVGLATANAECTITIEAITDTSITGTFTCGPSSDGYSTSGSFDASAG